MRGAEVPGGKTPVGSSTGKLLFQRFVAWPQCMDVLKTTAVVQSWTCSGLFSQLSSGTRVWRGGWLPHRASTLRGLKFLPCCRGNGGGIHEHLGVWWDLSLSMSYEGV